jgi:hypothetical protein
MASYKPFWYQNTDMGSKGAKRHYLLGDVIVAGSGRFTRLPCAICPTTGGAQGIIVHTLLRWLMADSSYSAV